MKLENDPDDLMRLGRELEDDGWMEGDAIVTEFVVGSGRVVRSKEGDVDVIVYASSLPQVEISVAGNWTRADGMSEGMSVTVQQGTRCTLGLA
jgi:hypothetical protein